MSQTLSLSQFLMGYAVFGTISLHSSFTNHEINATSRGPKRYLDMPVDIPNFSITHGYFNSENRHYLKPRDHGLLLQPYLGKNHLWFGGGGSGKSGKKNSTATRPGKKKLNSTTPKKKKTQLNNLEEQRLVAEEKKLNSRLARKKKVQRLVAEEKKTQHEFSARGPPPDP